MRALAHDEIDPRSAGHEEQDMEPMTTTTTTSPSAPKPRRTPVPLNGVDTPTLFATIGAVKAQPELAHFTFRATNRWQLGTHSRTIIESFDGAGGTHRHARELVFDADHPAVLVGRDQGPTPVEFLLHALASCITAGIGNVAAARGVTLYEVESKVEGEIDLRGILGVSSEVRNGYRRMRVAFTVKGDASPEKLREIVEQGRARSAVYDVLTNGIPVEITCDAG
ncbi:OsmC family protein [Anaeromyxobacter oryzae]|uniref:Osmotically inducible protein C n=1 Tax=Anaeromyxobacter oryzae TaxID=2918170 RepID=A0ABM7WTZ7_9BACT|nr:OsmC family protein [Anaeromyxobacter oryzae]BDG02934.1 osmotically inducible protein C [Anaeromyxobacter oryzae]